MTMMCFESGLKSLKRQTYEPIAQNEFLQIMALNVLYVITSVIAESVYYSIVAGESTDAASNIEQLVISIRWMN